VLLKTSARPYFRSHVLRPVLDPHSPAEQCHARDRKLLAWVAVEGGEVFRHRVGLSVCAVLFVALSAIATWEKAVRWMKERVDARGYVSWRSRQGVTGSADPLLASFLHSGKKL
jgi:hypothetical protein